MPTSWPSTQTKHANNYHGFFKNRLGKSSKWIWFIMSLKEKLIVVSKSLYFLFTPWELTTWNFTFHCINITEYVQSIATSVNWCDGYYNGVLHYKNLRDSEKSNSSKKRCIASWSQKENESIKFDFRCQVCTKWEIRTGNVKNVSRIWIARGKGVKEDNLRKDIQTDQNKEATELQKKSDKKQFHISKLILKKPQLEKDFRKWPI